MGGLWVVRRMVLFGFDGDELEGCFGGGSYVVGCVVVGGMCVCGVD